MKKLLSLLSFSLILSAQNLAHAEVQLNMDDKTDTYALTTNGVPSGEVTVKSLFNGEPLVAPVRISVSVKCKAGFRLKDQKLQKSTWRAYDFGSTAANARLSSFDETKQLLTVYDWTSTLDDDQAPVHDKERQHPFNLFEACSR